MSLLNRVRYSSEPWRELPKHWGVVVSSSEAECLQQLVIHQTYVQEDDLEEIIREFSKQRKPITRLRTLRELAVRVGNAEQIRQLLTSADQLELDDLLIFTVEKFSSFAADAKCAEHHRNIISLLLDTKNAMSADTSARRSGKTAFHVASQYGNHNLLTLLVPSEYGLTNALTGEGESVLHCIVRAVNDPKFIPKGQNSVTHNSNLLLCVRKLVENLNDLNIDLNMLDKAGIPAVHTACKIGAENIVRYLITKNVNIDILVYGTCARDIIRDKKIVIDNIPDSIGVQKPEKNYIQKLFELITNKNDIELEQKLEKLPADGSKQSIVNSNNGEYTLLQATVKFGLPKSTSILLEKRANVNAKCGNLNTPIMLAVENCDKKILKILLNNTSVDLGIVKTKLKQYTALHLAVQKGTNHAADCQCVTLLCEKLKSSELDIINKVDYKNNTALHYAAENRQEQNIICLLRNKANIFILNDEEIPAFAGIKLEILRGYLDDQISIEDENDTYKMITDFQFLVTPLQKIIKISSGNDSNREDSCLINISESTNNTRDMDSLLLFAESPIYKPLLNHPLIRSFLSLKWHRFFWIFFFNFMMFAIFTISLSVYIYCLVNKVNLIKGQNGTISNEELLNGISSDGKMSIGISSNSDSQHWRYTTSKIFTYITCSLLFIRELFQIAVSLYTTMCNYISNIVNLMELALIGSSIYLLLASHSHYDAIHIVSVIAILLAYTELVILIGSLPFAKIYYIMLLTVTKKLLYLLVWYSVFIFAFGISFYILFQHCEDKECSQNVFATFWTSIFKTTIMLQGEFDSNNLNFGAFSIFSHLIFLLFFFSMVIVLMNLLNGLAVSDVQAIRNESDTILMEKLVELYAKLDKIIYNLSKEKMYATCENIIYFMYNFLKRDKVERKDAWLIKHTKLLEGKLPKNKIEFDLKDKKLTPEIRNCCYVNCFDFMPSRICCIPFNCFKSENFKKIAGFEKNIKEMIEVHMARANCVRNYDSELEREISRYKIQREQEKMWSELSKNQKMVLERLDSIDKNILSIKMAEKSSQVDAGEIQVEDKKKI